MRTPVQTQLPALAPVKLYKVHEVMRLLSISRSTVYRLVRAGKLRLVKIGARSSFITAESVDALLAEIKAAN
ncbi:helix-turn-helix domain-containing protein [Burkholderia pseudomallei]|uniref:helix-turn-helix transcriptional regulator n=1 Tax=Burkholderia pseudomallei TaxID=28450 RepID=UPI0018DB5546|nr:helix-turn-helix domain-containing protein [Burkholderia pseudomallei]MBH9658564.1 helix-turn-helix domain-containing protein [Burkholderia pseudomallei]